MIKYLQPEFIKIIALLHEKDVILTSVEYLPSDQFEDEVFTVYFVFDEGNDWYLIKGDENDFRLISGNTGEAETVLLEKADTLGPILEKLNEITR